MGVGLVGLLPLFAAAEDDLVVAREALRDGLWNVARRHAAGVRSEMSRMLILESYAREGRWEDILKTLGNWGNPDGAGYLYYRAAAQLKLGNAVVARDLLAATDFVGTPYAANAARLRAEMLVSERKGDEALKLLEGQIAGDPESMMTAAAACVSKGDRALAEKLWRGVLAASNVSERAYAVAAANLSDLPALRRSYETAAAVDVRRFSGLRLGRVLVGADDTFAEGEKMIRRIVRDAPDSPGARDAFFALAETFLDKGDGASATTVFADALEMWPDAAKDAVVQQGRGWAFAETGRCEDALVAYRESFSLATNDEIRALAKVKVGDILSRIGRIDEAMGEYRDVLEKYPSASAAARVASTVGVRELEAKGRAAFAAYRFEEAGRIFREVAEKDPARKPRMEFFGIMCLYGLGRDAEAETLVTRLAAESGDLDVRAEATLWLGKFLYNRGKWHEAEARFIAYVNQKPSDPASAEALVWAARAAFAANDFDRCIQIVSRLVSTPSGTAARLTPDVVRGLLIQGEALIELARFDEAILILERAAIAPEAGPDDRLKAQLLRSDALFAMGADNPARYQEALEAFRALTLGGELTPSAKLQVAYKIGKTLEMLKRADEAVDQYYTQVVLAYRDARTKGVTLDDEARAVFSRAAFRLAEEFESRGGDSQALQILELIEKSDVPVSEEAAKRRARIRQKGNFL